MRWTAVAWLTASTCIALLQGCGALQTSPIRRGQSWPALRRRAHAEPLRTQKPLPRACSALARALHRRRCLLRRCLFFLSCVNPLFAVMNNNHIRVPYSMCPEPRPARAPAPDDTLPLEMARGPRAPPRRPGSRSAGGMRSSSRRCALDGGGSQERALLAPLLLCASAAARPFPEPRRIDLAWIEARAPAGIRPAVQTDAPGPLRHRRRAARAADDDVSRNRSTARDGCRPPEWLSRCGA
ncbi:hypothetical protein M885DRAFT_552180 [Pelagophyceae sp. CCMP2097]|nr:hypothetical protein M885DRAFT_552180 [Pelagophyceae sp. CCMP2097]